MHFFYLILLCFFGGVCFSQSYTDLINTPPFFIEEVDVSQLKENQLYIAMPFAKKLVLNPGQKKQLTEKVVIKLELVYTKHKTSPSFNQKKLNTNRLKELNTLVPLLFENRFWEFKLISQTKANSRLTGKQLFHGFIVTFRPNSSKKMLDAEANYLDDLASSLLKTDSIKNDSTPLKYDIKTHYDKTYGYIHDTIWYVDTVKPPSPPDFFYLQELYNDTTVLGAFRRNKNWKNFIIVADVTGSMSPYSAQVFVWLKQQIKKNKAKGFVFFNDGDEKPSKKKRPLETRGIYVTKNITLEKVIKTATKCMKNGSGGGEYLENDIEAIIDGIKQSPEADEVILVADNLESMRDYKYISKIKRPVHIILCGAAVRVNVQYLDLARQTKGSVHTIKNDVFDLHLIKEKKGFFIGDSKYLYENGRFHSVYKN